MQAHDLDGICRMGQGSTFWPSWYLWVEQPWTVHLRRPALHTGCRRPSVPDLVTWIIFSAFLSQPAWLSGISSTVSPSSVSRDSSWVTVPGKLSLTPVSPPGRVWPFSTLRGPFPNTAIPLHPRDAGCVLAGVPASP